MNTAQVIPFQFDAREVRTMLVDDQPWFVASDVALALMYAEAKDMTRNLDEDEKGRQIVPTLGGEQEMLVINESGLYSAILRSRKAEAKRFKKWITAEVLPAIRRTGHYHDSSNKMATLVDALIGMTEVNVLKGLIRDKAKVVPLEKRRSFQQNMHNRLHTRFNVPRIELIQAGEFEAACNFVAAYALEGEWLPRQERVLGTLALDRYQAQDLANVLHYADWVCHRWHQGIGDAVKALNPRFHSQTWEFFRELQNNADRLERSSPEMAAVLQMGGGKRPHELRARGVSTATPAD
ncbi:BRO-N domain-containing protein [Pseudomonas sp. SP16.1]|uniref:BRO-N domain-containing protein n=1 Tax=Pseudomonas sp. SP16.1 TaxID=3458854 RepID=UPI0040457180